MCVYADFSSVFFLSRLILLFLLCCWCFFMRPFVKQFDVSCFFVPVQAFSLPLSQEHDVQIKIENIIFSNNLVENTDFSMLHANTSITLQRCCCCYTIIFQIRKIVIFAHENLHRRLYQPPSGPDNNSSTSNTKIFVFSISLSLWFHARICEQWKHTSRCFCHRLPNNVSHPHAHTKGENRYMKRLLCISI